MTRALINHPAALVNMVCRIAIEAGRITLEHFDETGQAAHTIKPDGTPVTEADQQAEQHIRKALSDILPDVPVIGEEGDKAAQPADGYFWLVDPLDGTKAFLRGDPDFTVNIALVQNGVPTIGVIYAPALGELYWAYRGGPAMRYLEDTDREKQIVVRKLPQEGLTVITSQTHDKPGRTSNLIEQVKLEKRLRRSSSIKFCMIASGKADLYPRFGPTSYWDTAAGQVILEAAGGAVVDAQANPLRYDLAHKNLENPDFIAGSDAAYLQALLQPG